ncbi:Ti-type conjugative transfer relaxase TraA [Roseomonas rosea]|uniref:Ti-type conjugative transfer relaxase TraA n=1 Tax=Muricoccus roseus TaxID=198092 RepID=A0A1M6SP77_9PROT|nr:Ti-type conjugative transfer relaxase TraA [Roseomonas rosea]SHK46485.1 Ti-type conjugative transfer relaxase TraA [Roseomonas rosea]
MAIYHFSAKVVSRGAGRSAVAAAAYRAAERLHDERLGRDHDFTAKAGVVHSEILAPEGAPERWRDRAALWNEVEAGERRKDAQLARDVEIALPRELSKAEAVALARDFVEREFVARGMVADLNVHWAVGKDGEAQPHAHVMLTMRRVEGEGFGPKAREWNGTELLVGWRERWAELANARLHELGHEARIDHRSLAAQGIALEPQGKVGPAGERRAERGEEAERRAEHDAIARRNGERIAADPALALDALTRQQSTFTRQDLARFVSRHTDGAEQFGQVVAVVEAAPDTVRLGQDGRGRERFTTRDMLAAERRMEDAAEVLARSRGHAVSRNAAALGLSVAEARSGQVLGDEQQAAVRHVVEGGGDLALVVGYAGTGKSAMLGAAREAWRAAGYNVRGAALSGIAAEGLEAGSGIPSRTLASLEWGWREGREADRLTSRDVLVVDEAGMVGSRQLERVLTHAREAGAKVVLVGDPEQLQAIEAGAAFRALAERHGAAEIAEVRRQREGWQRDATRELATGRTGAALDRYEVAGMVRGHVTGDEARAAVVAGWAAERRESPHQSRIMLAHTRADVAALNALARERLREAEELGPERAVATENGPRAMAAGDRVMFLRNERALGAQADGRGGAAVKNGTLGTVLAVEAGGERLTVALDGAGGQAGKGEAVTFYLRDYGHLEHGYAATVHKAQGVTVDRAHVLAGAGMDRHAAYVALTRHREGVQFHWSTEAFASREGLARILSRERAKDTALDYAGPKEEREAARFAKRRGFGPLAPASEIAVRRPEAERAQAAPRPRTPSQERARAAVDRALHWHERQRAEKREIAAAGPAREARLEEKPAPLLPAHRDPWGRDSQGRGTTPGEVAAAVRTDRNVQHDAHNLAVWIGNAYRDPTEARRRLDALEAAEGGPKGAERALDRAGPELLGELQGKAGWFASGAAKMERERATRCAGSVGAGLVRLRESEERAGAAHVRAVEWQKRRDAVEIPGLSPAVWAAVRALEAAEREGAKDRPAAMHGADYWAWQGRVNADVGAAWAREVVGKPEVAAELAAVVAAMERRFGDDEVRRLRRGGRELHVGEETLSRVVGTESRGRLAHEVGERAAERQREAQQERLGLRQGRGMQM